MAFITRQQLDFPRDLVWEWHTRMGAIARLTPPFLPMTPTRQATDLRDGTTVFNLPGGLQWKARHDADKYIKGERFADYFYNTPLKQLGEFSHIHNFSDTETGGTQITDEVHTKIPASLFTPAFAYRQHQLSHDLAAQARLEEKTSEKLTIAVTGSHGTVGTALAAYLSTAGHTVIPLVRENPGEGERLWDTDHPAHDLLDGIDVLVHLAGEPLLGRFNDTHKAEIYSSRVGPTRRLAELVARIGTVRTMVCASAIGFYGPDRGDELLDENAERGEGFLADVVHDWEQATTSAREAGTRVVNVRTGVVMSGSGGMLPLLSMLFSTGLGGKFGDGSMWTSWIALDDLTDIYATAIIDDDLHGPINACAPNPVRNAELASALGGQLHRPSRLSLPAIGPALMLGKQGANELALANQRIVPQVLNQSDFRFRYPELENALAHELGKETLADDPTNTATS